MAVAAAAEAERRLAGKRERDEPGTPQASVGNFMAQNRKLPGVPLAPKSDTANPAGSMTGINSLRASTMVPPPDAALYERVDKEIDRRAGERRLDAINKRTEFLKQEARRDFVANSANGLGGGRKSSTASKPPPPPPEDSEEHKSAVHMATVLNRYRELYGNKIRYSFQPNYSPTMGTKYLKPELDAVRIVVNSQGSSDVIRVMMESLGVGIHHAHVRLNRRDIVEGNVHFEEAFKKALKAGHFDDELEQIDAEYGHYLAFGPVSRLASKVGKFYWEVAKTNRQVDPAKASAASESFPDL